LFETFFIFFYIFFQEVLIQKIVCDDGKDFDEQYKKALETLQAAVLAMQKVYDKTQELYQEKDLLSLPWLYNVYLKKRFSDNFPTPALLPGRRFGRWSHALGYPKPKTILKFTHFKMVFGFGYPSPQSMRSFYEFKSRFEKNQSNQEPVHAL
jgi:hypothetical protein